MGDKKISIRTLPSGERVTHSPPDDLHPEGRMDLIADVSPLRDRLNAAREDHQARHAELKVTHTEAIALKKADQQAKGLPEEKSAI